MRGPVPVLSAHAAVAGGMAEAQESRVQEAVDGMVQRLERESIRKMQANMFRCSASCCDNDKVSMQQVRHCIERCHAPFAQAQSIVTSELERFQDRLTRCTMHCSDKAKDMLDSGSKEQQVKQQLEACVMKCVDDHMQLIPSMTKKMKENLAALEQ